MITLLTALVGAGLGVWNLVKGFLETRPYVTLGPTPERDLTAIRATVCNPSRRVLQIAKMSKAGECGEIGIRPHRPHGTFDDDIRDSWIEADGERRLFLYVPPNGSRILEVAKIQPGDDATFCLHWHRHDWRERFLEYRRLQLRFSVAGRMMEQINA